MSLVLLNFVKVLAGMMSGFNFKEEEEKFRVYK